MELALTIIAGIGILLFLIGYIGFVFAGFKHHFITGIIAALPVLNIVTLPALWDRTSKKIMLSAFGIIITGVSWFFGANTGIQKTIAVLQGKQATTQATRVSQPPAVKISPTVTISAPATSQSSQNPADSNLPQTTKPFANKQRIIDESRLQGLPSKPLYKMAFEAIPINKITALTGRVIQVTTNNNENLEGRVLNVSRSSVIIQTSTSGTQGNEIPIANIKQLKLMVKKTN